MNREELKKLAEKTINISKNKSYKIGDEIINFDTQNHFVMFEDGIKLEKEKSSDKAKIEIYNESTIKAIHRMANGNLGVLNFASAKNPCGGFLGGSMAQEECLAYCSDLFLKQWPIASDYYYRHRENPNPFYTHTMFIDNVTFFRDENFVLVKNPTECKVLTSAAVNLGVAKKQGKSEKEANNIMKSRMRKILNCFIVSDCTDIILGAFGCGVFGNSAEKIATFWKELLYDEEYIYYFNNICFSVLDTNATKNYDIFCEVLQNTK